MLPVPIIIINWNGYEDTVSCIRSVLASTEVEVQIYLLDNGSEQNEGQRLQQLYSNEERVKVYVQRENVGFTRGNNLILAELLQQEYPYIALLNNDTEVEPDWLHQMLTVARRFQAQVVAAKLIRFQQRDSLDNVGHFMLNTGEILPLGHGEAPDQWQEPVEQMGSCAAATLYAADMLRDIGTFDPFFTTGYEDAELGVRAVIAGYKSVFAPKAVVYHKVGRSVGKIFDQTYATMIQECIWYSYLKLMPLPVIMLNLPIIMSKILLLSFLNLITGRWRYLTITWKAIGRVVGVHWPEIRKSRAAFYLQRKTLPWFQLMRRQTFFLVFDWKRFVRHYLQRQPSALDQYGG